MAGKFHAEVFGEGRYKAEQNSTMFSYKIGDGLLLPTSCYDSCTSVECLSDTSSCEDWSGETRPHKVSRQHVGFVHSTPADACETSIIDSKQHTDEIRSLGQKNVAVKELATALTKSCITKEKLSITIPQSEYHIFPSDLPKSIILGCIQSVFDSISSVFNSRFDGDKRSWSVCSSMPDFATRFKIHVYEFDGITHVEMRVESGCSTKSNCVFDMLQAAVGRQEQFDNESSTDLDSLLSSLGSSIPCDQKPTERETRRNLKAMNRLIENGSILELDRVCEFLITTSLHDELCPILTDVSQLLLNRLRSDNIFAIMSNPEMPHVNIIPGAKKKRSLKSNRQKVYSIIPKSNWNTYVKASDALRRLSTSVDCQSVLLENNCTVSYFADLITKSAKQQKAYLFRRNITKVLQNLSACKPYEVLLSGITEKMCQDWLSIETGRFADTDPVFVRSIWKIIKDLGFSCL